MSDYSKTTDFETKDGLAANNPAKIIKGAEFDTEFENIETAIATKADYFTGTFTPTLKDAISGGNTATVGSSAGRYTKVGRVVHATLHLTNIDTSGLGQANQVSIHDLPFASYNDSANIMYWVGSAHVSSIANPTATNSGHWIPVLRDNNDYISFMGNVSNSQIPEKMLVQDLTTNVADIYVSITYEAAES